MQDLPVLFNTIDSALLIAIVYQLGRIHSDMSAVKEVIKSLKNRVDVIEDKIDMRT